MTDSSGEDLVFGASIEDKTKEFFDTFNKNVEDLGKKTEKGFDNVSSSIQGSSKEAGIMAGVVAAVTGKVTDLALEMIDSFAEVARQAMEVRVQLEAMSTSMEVVGNNAGFSNTELSGFVEGIKGAGFTTMEATQALTKLIQGELNVADASKLATVASDAAAVANIDQAAALRTITQAIEYQSPRMLRSMGILVDFKAATEQYAATLGKEAKNLSDAEKKQAALNAVLREGEAIQGAAEKRMKTVVVLNKR